ncbi:MAG: hypothetical protein IJ489_02175 [Clostridia bacterium]|nr:hypothetical protein [Clostridia bacterium]
MKRVLSVIDPIITHTPPIANLFSILGTNPNTESWIMNNFVNIYIHENEIFDNFYDRNTFFYGCPWIQVVQIRREIVLRICDRIIDYVKALIDEGFYVYVAGNTECIPAYPNDSYGAHNFMVYGYDDENKEFYFSDFFLNSKYARGKCSYSELEEALKTSNMNRYFVNLIYGLKLKDIEYKFEIDLLSEKLTDYLNSTNLFCKFKTRKDEEFYSNKGGNTYNYFSYAEMKSLYFFGLSYYDKLTEMVQKKSKKLKRPLDLLYEHKFLMSRRINFLYQNKYIIESEYEGLITMCKDISKLSLINRNGYIKYQMKPSDLLLRRINERIIETKEKDCLFTERLLKALDR